MHKIGMTKDSAALRIRAPHDTGRTANDYGLRFYDCTTAAQANAIPTAWKGTQVIITNRGSVEAFYAFSKSALATIDETPTATAAGEVASIGRPIAAGAVHRCEMPIWEVGDTMYLIRRCASSTTSLLLDPGEPE